MDAADDVGDDGLRGVEDAALDFELLVVGAEEVLVEVDDGVFAAGLVAEVAEDGGQVGLVAAQEFDDVLDAEFVEINRALAAAHAEEGLEHFLQERIRDRHHVGDVLGDERGAVASLAHLGARDGGGEQAVGDGLRVGVGEGFLGEVVDEGGLEGGEEFHQRAALGLRGEQRACGVADGSGECGHFLGETVRGANDVADAVAEG